MTLFCKVNLHWWLKVPFGSKFCRLCGLFIRSDGRETVLRPGKVVVL